MNAVVAPQDEPRRLQPAAQATTTAQLLAMAVQQGADLDRLEKSVMDTKTCSKCGESKDMDCFGPDKRATDSKQSQCRECMNYAHRERARKQMESNPDAVRARKREEARRQYAKNPGKFIERQRQYYARNHDKCKERRRAYVAKNREKVYEAQREWGERNKDKLRQYRRKRYWKDPVHAIEAVSKYRNENPEKAALWRARWKEKNRGAVNAQARRAVERMTDSYIATTLKLPVSEIPESLIEAKRVHLQIHRLLRDLTK